jgi:methylmalonyl-CoA mutase C-terminal domain/subunit
MGAERSRAMSERPLRVLLSKVGLDGHDRGLKVVAAMLRDAGMEVIYLGVHGTGEEIVDAAIQENVDVIGLSSLGGPHLAHARDVLDRLRARDLERIPVVMGGTIPVEDIPALEAAGVRGVFLPGSLRAEIVTAIMDLGRSARSVQEDRSGLP